MTFRQKTHFDAFWWFFFFAVFVWYSWGVCVDSSETCERFSVCMCGFACRESERERDPTNQRKGEAALQFQSLVARTFARSASDSGFFQARVSVPHLGCCQCAVAQKRVVTAGHFVRCCLCFGFCAFRVRSLVTTLALKKRELRSRKFCCFRGGRSKGRKQESRRWLSPRRRWPPLRPQQHPQGTATTATMMLGTTSSRYRSRAQIRTHERVDLLGTTTTATSVTRRAGRLSSNPRQKQRACRHPRPNPVRLLLLWLCRAAAVSAWGLRPPRGRCGIARRSTGMFCRWPLAPTAVVARPGVVLHPQ